MIKEIKRLLHVYTKGAYRWIVLFPSLIVVTYLLVQYRVLTSIKQQFGTYLGWGVYFVVGMLAMVLGFLLIAGFVDILRKSKKR